MTAVRNCRYTDEAMVPEILHLLLDIFSTAVLLLAVMGALSIIIRTIRNGAPPMPSSAPVRAQIVALLREYPHLATVVELGSGWGTLSLAMSRALPAARIVGYENSPVPYLFSVAFRRLFMVLGARTPRSVRAERGRTRTAGSNLSFIRADFHNVSLREADAVVCYLSPAAMAALVSRLSSELKPGAIVVSSTFSLPGRTASRVAVAGDIYRTPVYVYVSGDRESGASSGARIDIVG